MKSMTLATSVLLLTVIVQPATSAEQNRTSAKNLAAACAMCHGTNGVSVGILPALAGQPGGYLAMQLRDFRDGRRPATIMHQIARGYTDAEIDLLAAYFAAQRAR